MSSTHEDSLEIFGALLDGFAKACLNLNIVAGRRATELTHSIEMLQWYPYQRLRDLENIVFTSYNNSGPILERVGSQMMWAWYHFGPGQQILSRGVDFLHFQSSSNGYASVVKGPLAEVGSFNLVEVDSHRGSALIHSTTPFNKDLERGVIIGGMEAPGDLDYVDVDYDGNGHFRIEFH